MKNAVKQWGPFCGMMAILLGGLEAGKRLGITLPEGGLMMPSKSVTAVIGISPVKGFCRTEGCEACEKKDCPYRRSLGQGRET